MEQYNEQSPIRRVIGLPKDFTEEGVIAEARRLFQNPEALPYEREKTEHEKRITENVLSLFPKFLEEYGITALAFTPEHVHVADEYLLTPEQKAADGIPDKTGGFYMEGKQGVVVFPSEHDLLFAGRIMHEILHGNSFCSFDTSAERKDKVRRIGLAMVDEEGNRYFHYLNEALTEELAKRFDKKYSADMPSLAKAVIERKEFIASIKNPRPEIDEVRSVITRQNSDDSFETSVKECEYAEERKYFLKLIDDIYEKNRDKFNSSEDVFRMFVRAAFTGRILELARLIEDAFGKEAFSKLGQKTALLVNKKKDEQQKFNTSQM